MTGRTAAFSAVTIVNWTVLLCVVAALIVFAATYGRRKESEAVRLILVADSAVPAARLQACLARGFPLAGGWQADPLDARRQQAWDQPHQVRADIVEQGKGRRMEIFAPGAKPLDETRSEAVKTCLRGG